MSQHHVANAGSSGDRSGSRLQLVVVPHTHWDREWYLPFEQFRIKLVRLIDRLFRLFETEPGFTHFMLDGQTVVLEDYLAIRPEAEGHLRELVTSGRMAVGPWYVLPDEFLVSGESLIRNLQIGMGVARRFGPSMELGYLPDSFGHVAQMPQLFAGFGFEAAALWRGVGEDVPGCEWNWAALDGTSVYLQWLPGGYGNLANLSADPEEAFTRLNAEVEKIAPHARASTYVLFNGSDHLMPQAFLPAHVAAFNARSEDWEVTIGSLAGAIERARQEALELDTVQGELRSAALSHLLPGVLSARTYLKQANVEAQNLLERWVEPFTALAALEGAEHPGALLRHTWKLLLQNHPHDSICGCSVDGVHRQMLTRFEQVQDLGTSLRASALAVLQGEDPEAELPRQQGLSVYNPHPWPQRAVVRGELTLDCDPDAPLQFRLVDEQGLDVPYALRGLERGVRYVNRSPLYPLNVPVARVSVEAVVDLPPFGARSLGLERTAGTWAPCSEVVAGDDWIENGYFRVRVVDGGVEIHDRRLGETVLHHFENSGDRGDEYNFCALESETPLSSIGWRWDAVESDVAGPTARLVLTANWLLPAGLSADRTLRKDMAPLALTLTVSLHAGVRRVEFDLELDNRSRDHRLRAAFRQDTAIAETLADTPFGWVRRPAELTPADWDEPPVGTHPMLTQVAVERQAGLAGVVAPGLAEYEAEDDTLYVTLVRAVGWLSRDDLSSRKGDAGPMLSAPEAQCQGPQRFRYAWGSQDEDEPEGMFARRSAEFAVAPLMSPLERFEGPGSRSYLAFDQPAWQFSALKRSEDGAALVLRFFNGSAEAATGKVTLGFPLSRVVAARLDETPLHAVARSGDSVSMTLRGFEIVTLLLYP